MVIVVPWAKNPIASGATPRERKRRSPSSTAVAGLAGVLGTFSIRMSPLALSSRTRSVWVPPTSTPRRQGAGPLTG